MKKSTTSILFRVLSVADTFTLILGPGQDSINQLAGTEGIENLHNIICKVSTSVYTTIMLIMFIITNMKLLQNMVKKVQFYLAENKISHHFGNFEFVNEHNSIISQ